MELLGYCGERRTLRTGCCRFHRWAIGRAGGSPRPPWLLRNPRGGDSLLGQAGELRVQLDP